MVAYYNEHDKFAAAWLRNLIAAGHIAPGDVDERDIRDVVPSDLAGYTQCHFFAGIGVWSHALRRAGWPDSRPVWTASCPCQPFSQAGKGGGLDDERHLWPAFFHLVEQCRPGELFGEQVASKDGLAWLDLVQSDMEGTDYAFAALDICAAGFGAPHIRQRLYWLAHATGERGGSGLRDTRSAEQRESIASDNGTVGRLVDAPDGRRREFRGALESESLRHTNGGGDAFSGLVDSDGGNAGAERQQRGGEQRQQQEDGRTLSLAYASDRQLSQPGRGTQRRNGYGPDRQNAPTGPINGIWRSADWLLCRDGKWRPVRSGSFPLAHGAASRVGRLRAYGNAIVAPQAEEFIAAYLATEHLRLREGVFA